MDSRWEDSAAEAAVSHYRGARVTEEVALRVYTSRLIGGDPALVLHGGGNTSVKGSTRDPLGQEISVLYIKGSGWDLASLEPPGIPALRLAPLQALREVEGLSDEEMVNALRINLLDAAAPNPSVETLLHAFLPHRFVDHTHADAILALVDQPDPEARCAEVFGGRLAVLPFVFPGFSLSGLAARAFEADPAVEGIVLIHHGLVTFGETARESYERTIHYVTLAEQALARGRPKGFAPRRRVHAPTETELSDAIPIIRGALAEAPDAKGPPRRRVLHYRSSEAIRAFVGGKDVAEFSQRGVATPDHIIRTKNLPLLLPPVRPGEAEEFRQACRQALARYRADYHAYFQAGAAASPAPKTELDPDPRIVLLPGAGFFAVGKTEGEACIAADIYEHTIGIIARAEGIGHYRPLDPMTLFEMEYWSLEQAKLGKKQEKSFAGQVLVITGAASGIGAATALAFAAHGANLVLIDRRADALEEIAGQARRQGVGVETLAGDVTAEAVVEGAFRRAALRFGGVDIVVSNAGRVWQGAMADCGEEELRESFELNFFAHQRVAAHAVRIFQKQGIGGQLLFNASKSAFNPGPGLGPYTLPKAAVIALMKQYAVDYGAIGVRSNAVNADRVATGLFGEGVLEQRAAARGLTVEEYLSGNLLQRVVEAEDVAQAFVHLALSLKTTGTVLPVDGGNIAAAPR